MEIKINKCQNIINDKRCNTDLASKYFKFCKPCAKERCRIANNIKYHRDKILWEPYTKNCKFCNKTIEINDRYQCKRKYCDNDNKCSNSYRAKFNKKTPHKQDKISYKKTPCICPRCGVEHEMDLFWTGKLPARKYCQNGCSYIAGNVEGEFIDGYGVGYY